jgi:integrase
VTLFRYAQSKGYFPLERKTPAELVKKPTAEKPRKEIYQPNEMQNMLDTADAETLPFIALTGLGGVRAEEIVPEDPEEPALKWGDLDWDEKNAENPEKWNPQIYVSQDVAKTGEGRYIPIGHRLAELLNPWRKAKGRIVVNSKVRTYHLSKKIAEASGVPWKKNALRHSYGTYRVAITNDVPRVSLEMGNSVAMVMKHYRKPAKEETGKEWFGIT